jgi:hypothetical protein
MRLESGRPVSEPFGKDGPYVAAVTLRVRDLVLTGAYSHTSPKNHLDTAWIGREG